jgi:hypothetical protein
MPVGDDPAFRHARLSAIAAVRLVTQGDVEGLNVILDTEGDDTRALVVALAELASGLMMLMPPGDRLPVLAGLTARAVGPEGGRP